MMKSSWCRWCGRGGWWGLRVTCLVLSPVLLLVVAVWPSHAPAHTTSPPTINPAQYIDSLSTLTLEPALTTAKCGSGEVRTLVVVPSAPANARARTGVRDSWGALLPPTWALVFFVGATHNVATKEGVIRESETHQDIAQDTAFLDSYANLTLKTLSLLNWVGKQCPSAEFVLKVDDDVYINVQKLRSLTGCLSEARKDIYGRRKLEGDEEDKGRSVMSTVMKGKDSMHSLGDGKHSIGLDESKAATVVAAQSKISLDSSQSLPCGQVKPFQYINYYIDSKSHKYESYVFGGYLYRDIKPDRNPGSKWYLRTDAYTSNILPPFLSGTSYLLTTNIIPHLLDGARHTPIITLEDVYLSGLVGSLRLKLKLNQLEGWDRFRPRWDDACTYSSLLSVHGLSPRELCHTTQSVAELKPDACVGYLAHTLVWLNSAVSSLIPKLPDKM